MSLLIRFGEENVGHALSPFKRTIAAGEVYCDLESNLILVSDGEETILETDVRYWTVLEGDRIIYSCYSSWTDPAPDEPEQFCIINANADLVGHGYVTKDGALIYRCGAEYLRHDADGTITTLIDSLTSSSYCTYLEAANRIHVTETHPLTCTEHERIFTCDGEFLPAETRACNAFLLFTRLFDALTDNRREDAAIYKQQADRFYGQERITLADVDKLIDALYEGGVLLPRSMSGYHILKPILKEAYADRDLTVVLTNLIRANQGGGFCRPNCYFITRKFALLLKKLYKAVGDQNFRYYTQSYKELNQILKDFQEG